MNETLNVESESQPVTLDDLGTISREFSDTLSQVRDETRARLQDLPPEQRFREARKEQDRAAREFIEDLFEQKDRFDKIFRTSNGSTYFVIQSGEAMRIKHDEHFGYRITSFTSKLVLVDKDMVNEIRSWMKNDHGDSGSNLLDKPILKTDLKVGAVPVDFGIVGYPTIDYKEDETSITLLGEKESGRHIMASGFHIGHEVTEVIKK